MLKTGGKLVLIDTGNGNSGAPTSGTWMANFKAAGFDPAQVDTIIISHFHGDHINGMRLKDGTRRVPEGGGHGPGRRSGATGWTTARWRRRPRA